MKSAMKYEARVTALRGENLLECVACGDRRAVASMVIAAGIQVAEEIERECRKCGDGYGRRPRSPENQVAAMAAEAFGEDSVWRMFATDAEQMLIDAVKAAGALGLPPIPPESPESARADK